MKLLELKIENFGVFAEKEFEFSDRGLQVVHGPNEAGKSTLLQLLRHVLFGFPHRSPYAFADHNGAPAAEVRAEMANGDRLRFRRRKGRGNTVNGVVEDADVDEKTLAQLLGNARPELFEHVFAFSLNELSDGQASLEKANLSEALFGGGMGGLASLQRVRQRLRAEHEELFKPKGRKPLINELFSRVDEKSRLLREASVRPAEYKRKEQHKDELEQTLSDLRDQRDNVVFRLRRIERLESAFQPWCKLRSIRKELGSLGPIIEGPPDALTRHQNLEDRLKEATSDLKSCAEQLARKRSQLDGCPRQLEVLAQKMPIESLVKQVDKIRGFIRDLPNRQKECADRRSKAEAALSGVDPSWKLADLPSFTMGIDRQDEVAHLQRRHEKLDAEEAHAHKQLSIVRRRLRAMRREGAEDEACADCTLLAELVEQSGKFEHWRLRRDDLTAEIEQLEAEQRRHLTTLSAVASLENETADLPTPLESQVREFQRRFADSEKRIQRCSDRCTQEQATLRRREQSLKGFELEKQVPSRDELLEARRLRDQTWRAIRRTQIEGKRSEDGSDIDMSPKAFEDRVRTADQIADDRQARARDVAKSYQLRLETEQQQEQCALAEEELRLATKQRLEIEKEWKELWSASGILPGSPDVMREWLSTLEQLRDLRRRLQQAACEKSQIEKRIEEFVASLQDQLGATSNSPDQLLAEARRRVDVAREAAVRREERQKQQRQLHQDGDGFESRLADTQAERLKVDGCWRSLKSELMLPEEWSLARAGSALRSLKDVGRDSEVINDLKTRIRDMKSELAEFETQAQSLAAQLSIDAGNGSAIEVVLSLSQKLTDAVNAETNHSQLQAAIADLAEEQDKLRGRTETFEKQIASLFEAFETTSKTEFLERAEAMEKVRALQADAAALQREIDAHRGNSDGDEFERLLDKLEEASLHAEKSKLDERFQSLSEDYENARDELKQLERELEDLDADKKTLQCAQELECARSELADAVDRWAPLVLADSLVQRAVEQFERTHQPRMLTFASELFGRMTGGRYVALQRKVDEAGTLVLQQSDGKCKDALQLSTGTREQLYLAIRLAYIREYCRDAEPLPLVMDDVLVNFDESRARETLEVLHDFASDVQILFLTCHRHVVSLIEHACPDYHLVSLEPLSLTV